MFEFVLLRNQLSAFVFLNQFLELFPVRYSNCLQKVHRSMSFTKFPLLGVVIVGINLRVVLWFVINRETEVAVCVHQGCGSECDLLA